MLTNLLYIDPGSLTALIAVILGAVVGGLTFLRMKLLSLKHKMNK